MPSASRCSSTTDVRSYRPSSVRYCSARSGASQAGSDVGFIRAGFVREVWSHGPAGAIDRPRVAPVERPQVVGVELAARLDVGQALPAAADADDLDAELGGAVGDALDDGVEARHVAAAREHPDPLRHGHGADGSEAPRNRRV